MSRKTYRPLKVQASTAAAVFAFMHAAAAAYDRGRAPRWWIGTWPTADEAVVELLRRVDAHKARSSKKGRHAAKQRAAACAMDHGAGESNAPPPAETTEVGNVE